MHSAPHPLAGQTVVLKHNLGPGLPKAGDEYIVEDYWDRVAGKSWMVCDGNPACLQYAVRSSVRSVPLPIDNEVIYGKVGPFGYLVHVSEVE